jgi:hypothetical protein
MYCIIAPIASTASVILKRFHQDLASELQFHDSAHSTCQSSWAFLFDGTIRLQRRDKLCHGGWNIQRVHAKQHLGATNDGDYQIIHNQTLALDLIVIGRRCVKSCIHHHIAYSHSGRINIRQDRFHRITGNGHCQSFPRGNTHYGLSLSIVLFLQ